MKKLLLPLTVLTSFSISLALSVPPKADALEIEVDHPRTEIYHNDREHERFSVLYRRPHHEHWHLAGHFRDRYDAERAEHELRDQGYIARIERD